MGAPISALLGWIVYSYQVGLNGLNINVYCEREGIYFFMLWHEPGVRLGMRITDFQGNELTDFILSPLPYPLSLGENSGALVSEVIILDIKKKGLYSLMLVTEKEREIKVAYLVDPDPKAFSLKAGETKSFSFKASGGDMTMFVIMPKGEDSRALIKVYDPGGMLVGTSPPTMSPSVFPFPAIISGEYTCVLEATTKGDYMVLMQNIGNK